MKFYFETTVDYSPREEGKKAVISVLPESNGPKIKPVFLLIADELTELTSGQEVRLGMIGEKETAMVFPSTTPDNRVLLLADAPQPGHRKTGSIRNELTDAKILQHQSGYGAWGSGAVFLALLNPGQKVVTNRSGGYKVYWNEAGELKQKWYSTSGEYDLDWNQNAEIEFV